VHYEYLCKKSKIGLGLMKTQAYIEKKLKIA